MRHPLVLLLLAPAALAGLLPSPARAWTEANVESARAHVEVAPDGAALVAVALSVRIHGGWLEGLDIDGLDPDLTLSEAKPPWAVSLDDDLKFSPRVSVQGGRVSFSFRGRGQSPRRGRLELGFVYRTALGERQTQPLEEQVRVRWTLPGWRSGLDAVRVAITVPPGASIADEALSSDSSIRTRQLSLAGSTIVLWERPHLPRTVPWTLAVDVPAEAMDPALRAPPAPERPKTASGSADATEDPIPVAIVFLSLLICSLAARQGFTNACLQRGVVPRPVVPMPTFIAGVLGLALCAVAIWLWSDLPLVGAAIAACVTMLTLFRAPSRPRGRSGRGTWRAPTKNDRRRHRKAAIRSRLLGDTLFDITTPAGLATLGGIAFSLSTLVPLSFGHEPMLSLTALLIAVPFVSGTRHRLPRTSLDRLRRLEAIARRLDDLEHVCALAIEVCEGTRGNLWGARLVVFAELDDDVELTVHLADVRELDGVHTVPVLVAVLPQPLPLEGFPVEGFEMRTVGKSRDGRDRAAPARIAFVRPLGDQAAGLLDATISALIVRPWRPVDESAATATARAAA